MPTLSRALPTSRMLLTEVHTLTPNTGNYTPNESHVTAHSALRNPTLQKHHPATIQQQYFIAYHSVLALPIACWMLYCNWRRDTDTLLLNSAIVDTLYSISTYSSARLGCAPLHGLASTKTRWNLHNICTFIHWGDNGSFNPLLFRTQRVK